MTEITKEQCLELLAFTSFYSEELYLSQYIQKLCEQLPEGSAMSLKNSKYFVRTLDDCIQKWEQLKAKALLGHDSCAYCIRLYHSRRALDIYEQKITENLLPSTQQVDHSTEIKY